MPENNHPTNTQSFDDELKEVLDQHITYRDSGNPYIELDIPTCNKLVEAITSAHRTDMAAYQAQLLADYEDDVKQRVTQARIEEVQDFQGHFANDLPDIVSKRLEELKKGQ